MARRAATSTHTFHQVAEAGSDLANTSGHLRTGRVASHNPIENQQLRAEVALYIASMSTELANMARSANLDVLAYFLDMARMEARLRMSDPQPNTLDDIRA